MAVTVLAMALWLAAGCNVETRHLPTGPAAPPTGTARLTLSNLDRVAGSSRVTAVAVASGGVAGDTLVGLGQRATATVELQLAPARYLLHIQAFSDPAGTRLLGSEGAEVEVKPGVVVQLAVRIGRGTAGQVEVGVGAPGSGSIESAGGAGAQGGTAVADGGSPPAVGAGGNAMPASPPPPPQASSPPPPSPSAPVAVDAGAVPAMPSPAPPPAPPADAAADVVVPPPALGPPPAIDDVAVVYGLGDVKITVKAADRNGGRLTFQWAGAGIDGVAMGGPVRQVNNSDILASAARTVKVLVMGEDGAAALVSVKFDTQPGLLGGPRLAGSHAIRTRTSASALDAGDRACFETHTGCALGCRANGPPQAGGCVTDCGASLIRCCNDE